MAENTDVPHVEDSLTLPVEIIHLIIDIIALQKFPRGALMSCSLVSKAFHERSRQHLFDNPKFTICGEVNPSAKAFVNTFGHARGTVYSSIGLLHSLKLVYDDPPQNRTLVDYMGPRAIQKMLRNFCGRRHISAALSILSQAPLHCLTLESLSRRSLFTSQWQSLASFKCLRSLKLFNVWDVPPSAIAFIVYSLSLMELSLHHVKISGKPEKAHKNAPKEHRSTIQLLNIDATLYPPILAALGPAAIPLPDLRVLAVFLPFPSFNRFWEFLLKGTNSSITELCLRWAVWDSNILIEPISLNDLPALQHLSLCIQTIDQRFDLAHWQIGIVKLLSTATAPTLIETINLDFRIWHLPLERSIWPNVNWGFSWGALDNVLTGPAMPKLRSVGVRLLTHCSTNPPTEDLLQSEEDYEKMIQLLLPRASSQQSMTLILTVVPMFPDQEYRQPLHTVIAR